LIITKPRTHPTLEITPADLLSLFTLNGKIKSGLERFELKADAENTRPPFFLEFIST
jgi:hypothetical protein